MPRSLRTTTRRTSPAPTPPSLAATWWPQWSYNNHLPANAFFMVRNPLSNFKSNFTEAFRRHYVGTSESHYFENQLPMSADSYGGSQAESINNSGQLRMYYEGASENNMTNYAWDFGSLLNSEDFAQRNLWWDRLARPSRRYSCSVWAAVRVTKSCTSPSSLWTTRDWDRLEDYGQGPPRRGGDGPLQPVWV